MLASCGGDSLSRESSFAYKLDEAAEWTEWWEQLQVRLSKLTNSPKAPHYFRLCARADLNELIGENAGIAKAFPTKRGDAKQPESNADIVLVIKKFESDPDVHQILTMVPASRRAHLREQPQGVHARRRGGEDVRKEVVSRAKRAKERGVISEKALRYMTEWAMGTRRREPRPARYNFLSHRYTTHVDRCTPQPREPLVKFDVQVKDVGGNPMPFNDQPVGSDDKDAEDWSIRLKRDDKM